jgi:hypothetical protein
MLLTTGQLLAENTEKKEESKPSETKTSEKSKE